MYHIDVQFARVPPHGSVSRSPDVSSLNRARCFAAVCKETEPLSAWRTLPRLGPDPEVLALHLISVMMTPSMDFV